MPQDEFAKRMLLMAKPAAEFHPTATYDKDGDCIEFLAKSDPFYAERVDDLLTVYYSQETNEIIGSLIKGVSTFCKRLMESMPGFKIEIYDGKMKLQHIFLAQMWSKNLDPEDLATLTYKKLAEVAYETEVEADVCLA